MYSRTIHVWFPLMLMSAVILVSGYAMYGMPQGPWYKVIYLDKNTNALLQSAPHVDAIVADEGHTAIVYKKDQNIEALEHSNALIIDPKGVPLCLTSPY